MNYSSVLIPKVGDTILFEEYEVKIRSAPNLILSPSGKEPGFIFQFAFPYDKFLNDIPALETTFNLVTHPFLPPATLRTLNTGREIKDVPAVIYMYEPHIVGDTYNLYIEELEVHGKLTMTITENKVFIGMFKGGILDLPCIERAKDVDLERKSSPKCVPTPKPRQGKEYNKFETLDLS